MNRHGDTDEAPRVLHIGCAVEGEYVAHSAAMLHSVLSHTGGYEVQIHYLRGPGVAPDELELLAGMVDHAGGRISFVEVNDAQVAGLPTEGFTRKATWYRVLLPDVLPALDRILFLDADLLALDSLAPLWETDVTDNYLAAVTNVFQDDHLHRPAELGLDRPQDYFNAGVMLMNLELMRRDGRTEAMREYGVANADRLMFRDQDALNVALAARRVALHPRWNLMTAMLNYSWSRYVFGSRALEEARRDPAIRHFEGQGINKPWHVLCEAHDRELYFEHRRQTPWPRVRREGDRVRTFLPRVRRHLRWRRSRLRERLSV